MNGVEEGAARCGYCRWWYTGFCSSLEAMEHIGRETRTKPMFICRDRRERPLLTDCFCRLDNPIKEQAGSRPHYRTASSGTSGTKDVLDILSGSMHVTAPD